MREKNLRFKLKHPVDFKAIKYDCNKSSIILTLSLFLYKDFKSTNSGGIPFWKPRRM